MKPALSEGYDYEIIRPDYLDWRELRTGDRFLVNGTTFEVTREPTVSPSGKKYHVDVVIVDTVRRYWSPGDVTYWSGLTRTTVNRRVYRPQYVINEMPV